MTPPAEPTPPTRYWSPGRALIAPIAGLAGAALLVRLVLGEPHHQAGALGWAELMVVIAVVVLAVRLALGRRAKSRPAATAAVVPAARAKPPRVRPTDLDRGVQAIRRTDRGFDPARFAGYAQMTFRDVADARTAQDADRLRDRLTAEMHAELLAFGDGLRAAGRSVRFDEGDVRAEITEAWQDGDRDYVTAFVTGLLVSHPIGGDRSRAQPTPVEAFLTFTRPAGLNFWRLSIIQEP